MAISLTCVCGAILEIDDKFKGQSIPCPDCNRLIAAVPPRPAPKATSGWALASLIVSLAGMLTLIGPVVGIVCGVIGLRQIRNDPNVAGARYARAGIGCGAAFTLLSFWALFGGEFFGLDGFLRLFVGTQQLKFQNETTARGRRLPGGYSIAIKRPSPAWGILQDDKTEQPEDLTLVNLWDDAHIVVFGFRPDEQDKADECRREAINTFLKSGLVKSLSKLAEPAFPMPDQIRVINERRPRDQDFIVTFPWPGGSRVFLFHLFEGGSRVNVAVGGARESRFDRLEPSIRASLESCVLENKDD
jgi:hypothetical protein